MVLTVSLYPQEKDLDQLLGLNLEELMSLEVITASKQSQRISEVAATVRVITAAQIKERGYMTLEEALSDLPGIQFRNIVGFNSYIFLRGIFTQNQATLLLVDGVQINELNSGGFYAGGQFNLSNVKRIEVVYGPASALYGTNAISGIINIITHDPADNQGGSINVSAGNFNTRTYDAGYGYYDKKSNFGFSVAGMYKETTKADLGGIKGDNNWTDNMENFEDDWSLDGKLQYKDLHAGVVFQDKQASRTTNYKTIGSDYLDSGSLWHIRFFNGYLKYLTRISRRLSNQALLYYRNATVMDNTIAYIRSDTSETGGQTGYYRPNDLFGIENQLYITPIEKMSMIAGLVLERERLAESFSITYSGSPDVKAPVPPKPDMMTNTLFSGYLQLQYRILKNTELTIGFRHDNSSYYGAVNTPRIGLVVNYNKITAKLLYTEAFRAPKPWDYTYEDGNPDLKPEIMKSMELALGYTFTNNFIAQLSVYKNHMKRIFTREERRQTNGPRMNTDGFEVTLEYVRGWVKSYVNYTYNFSVYEDGGEVPEIGKNNANGGILLGFTKTMKLDIRGNYIGRRRNVKTVAATGSDFIDDAFVLHATLSFLNVRGFDFQIIGKNLLNTKYYHTSNNPPDRYRQPQRTVLFRAGYHFRFPVQ